VIFGLSLDSASTASYSRYLYTKLLPHLLDHDHMTIPSQPITLQHRRHPLTAQPLYVKFTSWIGHLQLCGIVAFHFLPLLAIFHSHLNVNTFPLIWKCP